MTATLITVLLTMHGALERQPSKAMASLEECRIYAARQDFFSPPPGYAAAFYYCEVAG